MVTLKKGNPPKYLVVKLTFVFFNQFKRSVSGLETKRKQMQFTVDNTIFSEDQELFRHIQENYIKELPSGSITEISHIQKQVRFAFPEYDLKVRKVSQGTTFIISLENEKLQVELLYDRDTSGKKECYSSVHTLIAAFRKKVRTILEIEQTGKLVKNLPQFSFSSYFRGYSDEEEVFEFVFINAQQEMTTLHFHPYEDTPERFQNFLRLFDKAVFEGPIINVRNAYGQIEECTIEGFPLKYLETLGKRVKIEILD